MTVLNKVLSLPRGSDILFDLEFQDDTGAPINMTGWTIAIFEADAWGTTNGSVAWQDQAGGVARLSAPWGNNPPDEVWFRIRATRTADGFDDAYPQLVVRFT
jgi:Uma2 family endonuclease